MVITGQIIKSWRHFHHYLQFCFGKELIWTVYIFFYTYFCDRTRYILFSSLLKWNHTINMLLQSTFLSSFVFYVLYFHCVICWLQYILESENFINSWEFSKTISSNVAYYFLSQSGTLIRSVGHFHSTFHVY